MSVIKGIRDLLQAAPEVANELARYDFGNGDEPGVFTVSPPPPDAPAPLIVLTQVGGTLTARDRSTRAGEIEIDVNVWGERGESEKLINDLAMDIWRVLDRAVVSVDGYETPRCLADPPGRSPDPDGYPGYLIRCRVLIRELKDSVS